MFDWCYNSYYNTKPLFYYSLYHNYINECVSAFVGGDFKIKTTTLYYAGQYEKVPAGI